MTELKRTVIELYNQAVATETVLSDLRDYIESGSLDPEQLVTLYKGLAISNGATMDLIAKLDELLDKTLNSGREN